MDEILRINNLSKRYDDINVLDNINLSVKRRSSRNRRTIRLRQEHTASLSEWTGGYSGRRGSARR